MRKVILAFAAVVLSLLSPTAAEEKAESPPVLEVVSRFALVEKPDQAFVDLRWASRNSIYLADRQAGIAEVKLVEGLPEVRRLSARGEGWCGGRTSPRDFRGGRRSTRASRWRKTTT